VPRRLEMDDVLVDTMRGARHLDAHPRQPAPRARGRAPCRGTADRPIPGMPWPGRPGSRAPRKAHLVGSASAATPGACPTRPPLSSGNRDRIPGAWHRSCPRGEANCTPGPHRGGRRLSVSTANMEGIMETQSRSSRLCTPEPSPPGVPDRRRVRHSAASGSTHRSRTGPPRPCGITLPRRVSRCRAARSHCSPPITCSRQPSNTFCRPPATTSRQMAAHCRRRCWPPCS
jgi:hypothetical protein